MNEILTDKLREISLNSGADLFGIADAHDFSEYTGKRNPSFYIDAARSVIVIGHQINDPMLDMWLNSINGKRHYYFINEVLGSIALGIISALLEEGKKAILSPYSGVYAKDAAALAGVGTIGKNNLLLTEQFGPCVRLRTIVTDAELLKTPREQKSFCDNCPRFCWSACPAGAFSKGKFSREACIKHSEEHTEKPSDNSNLFCRKCELACPVGK
jgi:epoxyqueuosine reductase